MATPLTSKKPETATAPNGHNSELVPPWHNVRRLLALRLDNLGDVIMTGPALRAVKQTLPQVELTLMASPGGAGAAPLLPWLDDVITHRALWQDLGNLSFDPGREWRLVSELRARDFDAAVIFTSFSQSPHPPALVCRLAGIPLRLGSSKEQGGDVLTHAPPSPPDEVHQVERNLQLLEAVGFAAADRRLALAIDEETEAAMLALLARHNLGPRDPFIVLSPWASCQARTYFPDRFAVAARGLAQATGWPVLVTGRAQDRERSRPILDRLGRHGLDLLGETSVPQLAALIRRSRLTLTNDSLAMHLADATRTPGLVLYSGTEYESQWQPRHSPHRLLRRPTPCSPCYAFTCPYNLECLDFTPQEVVAAGLNLLQQTDAAARRAPSAVTE